MMKLLMGHEVLFQEDRCNMIYDELIVMKDVLSGATGATAANESSIRVLVTSSSGR